MLKVMIAGCGGIAPAHVEGFLLFPDQARITVLANRGIERAIALNKKYGLNAKVVSDFSQALNEVDIVSICTPPGTHAEIAIKALESGCHVLLEKPMATSLAECDAILAAAEKANRIISVVAQSRFISNIRNAIDMVRGGKYGKLYYSRINSVWYRGQSYYDLAWRGRWAIEGGGCTLNHSIHHIDLLLWVKGLPEKLTATAVNLNHINSEEEDFSSSLLTFADGSGAEITSCLVSHGEPQLLSFQMHDAGIDIPFRAHASKSRENGFPEPDEAKKAEVENDFAQRPKLTHENHGGQIENFLGAINGSGKLLATGEDGRRAIELITGIYKSAMSGSEAVFPIDANDPYYTGEWRKTARHFHEKTSDVSGFSDLTVTDFKGKF